MTARVQEIAFFSGATAESLPLVGVSACLAGEKVRWDGNNKELERLAELRARLQLLPICPEFEAGLGVPRPPIQLVMTDEGPQVVGRDDPELNVTDALIHQRSRRYRQLLAEPLCGYIFKARSPSCGLFSTPVHSGGKPLYYDNGLFTDGLLRMLPWLVACEEDQLETAAGIDRFVRRCQLVQEILYDTGMESLMDIHRHYVAQLDGLENQNAELLESYASRENRQKYVELMLDCL